jgi:hypothetical protein
VHDAHHAAKRATGLAAVKAADARATLVAKRPALTAPSSGGLCLRRSAPKGWPRLSISPKGWGFLVVHSLQTTTTMAS